MWLSVKTKYKNVTEKDYSLTTAHQPILFQLVNYLLSHTWVFGQHEDDIGHRGGHCATSCCHQGHCVVQKLVECQGRSVLGRHVQQKDIQHIHMVHLRLGVQARLYKIWEMVLCRYGLDQFFKKICILIYIYIVVCVYNNSNEKYTIDIK